MSNPITKVRWRRMGFDAVIDMAIHLQGESDRLRKENNKLRDENAELRRKRGRDE